MALPSILTYTDIVKNDVTDYRRHVGDDVTATSLVDNRAYCKSPNQITKLNAMRRLRQLTKVQVSFLYHSICL